MFQCFNMFQKLCNMDKSIMYQSKKRSCTKFQIKKTVTLKHGQINATISKVSMFHMFLYIIGISIELPKSFQCLRQAACVCSYWLTKDYKAVCSSSPAAGWGRP